MSTAPQAVFKAVESLNATKYTWVASLVLLLYDHVLTFDEEIKLVWSFPPSLGRILFIWTRYFGLCSLIMAFVVLFRPSLSNQFCRAFFWWEAISALVITLGVEVILLARVYAVYNRSKKILYGAAVRLLTIISTIIIYYFYLPVGIGVPPIYTLTGCGAPVVSRLFGLSFTQSMMTEVILCACMLYKAWKTYKNDYDSPLLKMLIADSVIYFTSVFILMLSNSLIFFTAPQDFMQIAIGFEYTVPSIMGTRLLLNMFKRAFRRNVSQFQSQQNIDYLLSDMGTMPAQNLALSDTPNP